MSVKDFSLPEFAERREVVYFNPDVPLNVPPVNDTGNNITQDKNNITFTINDRGSIYDYANGYFDLTVRLELAEIAGGGRSYVAADRAAIINDIHSLIRRISFNSQTGAPIYDVDEINKAIFVRKLLEMSPDYAESVGENEYWYLDKSESPNDTKIDSVTGDAKRGNLRRAEYWYSATQATAVKTQNFRIPLKWYSYFQSLDWGNVMFTGMQLKIVVGLEYDNNLIWRDGGAAGRVVVEKMRLVLPQIRLRPAYYEEYVKFISTGTPIRWTYLRERIVSSTPTQMAEGQFKITSVYNPKKIFIYFLTNSKQLSQTKSYHIFDKIFPAPTGTIGGNKHCVRARLEFSDGSFYPHVDYQPPTDVARMHYDLLEYGHLNTDKSSGSQLTRSQFTNVNSMFYFDLEYKSDTLVTDTKDMTFVYTLSDTSVEAAENYQVYAIIYQEHEASYGMVSGSYELRDEVKR